MDEHLHKMFNKENKVQIRRRLTMCYEIYKQYNWLLNAYVLDYYVSDYWNRLPQSWRDSLKNVKPEMLANVIDPSASLSDFQLLPLSLLSLRQSIQYLNIPRTQELVKRLSPQYNLIFSKNVMQNEHFKNCFWKHIKLKKRHEIELIAEMCYKLANETQCHYIVDVGSGLGHLSRILCYLYGLRVCALEAQKYLSTEARKLDNFMENTMKNYFNVSINSNLRVTHLNVNIKTDANGSDILEAVKRAFGPDNDNIQFGIVGLHPCGNLGPTLIQLFKQSPQVKFLNIVGCCYMKLTASGYPLSAYSQMNNYKLEYSALEVACHALEAYITKLKLGQLDQLKVHAYRAVLEKLIVNRSPDMYHSQVKNVKCTNGLAFSEYCRRATLNMGIELSKNDIESAEIRKCLDDWRNVVVFYSLRLMVAPLVENIIMLDRILFILESGYRCKVTSLFDPQLSPRNQVLTAKKH